MRKMTLFLIISCMFLSTSLFANEVAPLAGQFIDGKYYVEPGTVHVAPNGIFLKIADNFVHVEAVCMDQGGIYVIGYNAVRMVICSKCNVRYDADNQSSKCPHGWKVQRLS